MRYTDRAKSASKAGAKPCIALSGKQQIVEYHHERNDIVHKNIACVKALSEAAASLAPFGINK